MENQTTVSYFFDRDCLEDAPFHSPFFIINKPFCVEIEDLILVESSRGKKYGELYAFV